MILQILLPMEIYKEIPGKIEKNCISEMKIRDLNFHQLRLKLMRNWTRTLRPPPELSSIANLYVKSLVAEVES